MTKADSPCPAPGQSMVSCETLREGFRHVKQELEEAEAALVKEIEDSSEIRYHGMLAVHA